MRVLFYCQHVLGVGHLFRSLEIARALAGHDVLLVTGGRAAPAKLPPHVRHLALPPLMMDPDFSRMLPGEAPRPGESDEAAVERIVAERKDALMACLREERPDAILVELFPFGRKRFGFELLPLLAAAHSGEFGRVLAACSLRDILVEKDDQAKFEAKVLDRLNPNFDLLLVHSDPALVRLEETFARTADIAPRVAYTGYVTPRPEPGAGAVLRAELGLAPGERMIVASAGGGAVGEDLVRAALAASCLLAPRTPHRLFAFSGPYCSEADYAAMEGLAATMPWARLERFATGFPAWLDAADLSVSMAGYNTTMNLLAAGTFGLVRPYDQNREQRMRAARLAGRGALGLLEDADLEPAVLARLMGEALARGTPPAHGLALDGAAKSAKILVEACACT